MDFKSGLREKPELIKVYEKISRGKVVLQIADEPKG